MKKELKCPKCQSKEIKKYENEDGYLHIKLEGEKAAKYRPIKYRCYCWKCGYDWECEGDINNN